MYYAAQWGGKIKPWREDLLELLRKKISLRDQSCTLLLATITTAVRQYIQDESEIKRQIFMTLLHLIH